MPNTDSSVYSWVREKEIRAAFQIDVCSEIEHSLEAKVQREGGTVGRAPAEAQLFPGAVSLWRENAEGHLF